MGVGGGGCGAGRGRWLRRREVDAAADVGGEGVAEARSRTKGWVEKSESSKMPVNRLTPAPVPPRNSALFPALLKKEQAEIILLPS